MDPLKVDEKSVGFNRPISSKTLTTPSTLKTEGKSDGQICLTYDGEEEDFDEFLDEFEEASGHVLNKIIRKD